jgi:hypothetical protein
MRTRPAPNKKRSGAYVPFASQVLASFQQVISEEPAIRLNQLPFRRVGP